MDILFCYCYTEQKDRKGGNDVFASDSFLLERKRLQRRSVRYAFLSLLLTAILLFSTGCSLMLEGNELSAYKCITNSSRLEDAKEVTMLSGRMYGGDLYGYFAYTSRYGYRELEMYRISSSGYTKTVNITLYTLTDSERCLAEGYLDLDEINSALEMHYGSPVQGLSGLAANTLNGGDHMFLYLVILIVALCLHGLLCSKASDIAQDKGYEKSTWFHMCFWLGPIPFVLVAAMPDLKLRTKQDETISQLKQLLEHAGKDRTNSLLSELIECTKENQAARIKLSEEIIRKYEDKSASSAEERKASVAEIREEHTESAKAATSMRRRGPVTPISQDD